MTLQVFLSGAILGFLAGALFCYMCLQWMSRQRIRGKKREIDVLTEQFQELFRQIDQDKRES